MTGLKAKLIRDLWRLRFQCLTIALLVGCGIANFASAVSAAASVVASREAFYADARLADVFARLKRAPRPVLDRLRDIPGVSAVDGRVVGDFRLVLETSTEAVVARFVSLRWPIEETLNQPRILQGRLVEPGNAQEVVLSAAFAEALGVVPGMTVRAVIERADGQASGRRNRRLTGVRVGCGASHRSPRPVALRRCLDGRRCTREGDGARGSVQRRRHSARRRLR